jgi:hypothetical protein
MKAIAILVVISLLVSCRDNTTSPIAPPPRVQLSFSHIDSLEAEEFALWFGGTLTPKDSLVDQVLYSLNYLRYVYRDSTQLFPATLFSERFLPPWTTHSISIKFDSATAQLVRSNQYTAWNMLPAHIRPDSVDSPGVLGWTLARYANIRNPWRLAEYYSTLPGVLACAPNLIIFTEGTFPIFPGIQNGEMTYVLVQSSLWPGTYHYFHYSNTTPIYAGVFSRDMNPRPEWYQYATSSMDTIYTWCKNGRL